MNKPNIYLAGKMSGLSADAANAWRLNAKEKLKENFHIINPCDYYNFSMNPDTYTDKEVKKFDLWAVMHSNIVLINLDYPDSIGTAIEIHMAYDVWNIPVIGFGGQGLHIHPWMELSITKRCETMEDAIQYINDFYLPNL